MTELRSQHGEARAFLGRGGLACGLALIVLAASGGCSGSLDDRPNVILIVVDTLRPDHLNHFGYDRLTAPALDDFASQATLFENVFAPAPWTAPSTASILTGLHPTRHGVIREGRVLSQELETIAEVLQDSGWNTAGHSFNHNVSSKTAYQQGFDAFDDFLGRTSHYPDIEVMINRAQHWLLSQAHRPFFLYLQPMNTHGPYQIPPGAETALLGRPPRPEFVYYGTPMKEILRKGRTELRSWVKEEYIASAVEMYDSAIRYSTDEIGRLLDTLRERGLYDNSMIILTADHGEEFFEHGGFSHGYSLYNELLRVPLYIKMPHQQRSRRVRSRVSLLDIYPTILDVLELSISDDLDGRSMTPLIAGEVTRDEWRTELVMGVTWEGRCLARSLISGRYKVIATQENYEGVRNQTQVFDLVEDPGELNDLSEARPELAARLLARLEERYGELESGFRAQPESVLEQMDLKRLEALGYAGGG